jgi:hypothetical protein
VGNYGEQLPGEYMKPEVFDALSLDAQIYFVCGECAGEWRLDQATSVGSPHVYEGRPCPKGDGGELTIVVHGLEQEAICRDCAKNWTVFYTHGGPIACPVCGSTTYWPISSRMRPPWPAQFGDLSPFAARHDYVWGVDPRDDAGAIHEGLKWIASLPDSAQYLIPASLFARRLRIFGEYDGPDIWVLSNLESVLLNEYYKRTGELTAGLEAVDLVTTIVDNPATTFARAAVQHNVAMFAYSLVAREQSQLHVFVDSEELRSTGVNAARKALDLYSSQEDSAEIRTQVARVRHVLGDLLKAGDATPDQIEESLHQLDRAVSEPALPENLGRAVRHSRAFALLRGGVSSDVGRAEEDLIASLTDKGQRPRERVVTYTTLARLAETGGNTSKAIRYLEAATTIAEQELLLADDEASIGQVAEQFRVAFDELARMRVALGQPRAALEAVETTRAATVRFAHESAEDATRRARAQRDWVLNRLQGDAGDPAHGSARRLATRISRRFPVRIGRTFDAFIKKSPLSERVDRALVRLADAGWPADAALCAFASSGGYLTAIVAVPHARGGWVVEAKQWPINFDRLEEALAVMNPEPGVFRERRLATSCAIAGDLIVAPVIAFLRQRGVHRLAISAPGLLSHLPYEAVPIDGHVLGEEFDVCYVPSVALAADLAARRTAGPPQRILAVLYGGEDLPHAKQEIEGMRALWGSSVDVLYGADCSKRDVLQALSREYDLVHFACHGTFDALDPLQSSLFLNDDHSRDSKRITAHDLLGRTLPGAPTVSLSACSSSLTSYGLTNDCTGLTGSLLRAGARAVIGSRWAVFDDTAANFMCNVYEAITDGVSGSLAISGVQRAVRANRGIEDWAAFSYLGVP